MSLLCCLRRSIGAAAFPEIKRTDAHSHVQTSTKSRTNVNAVIYGLLAGPLQLFESEQPRQPYYEMLSGFVFMNTITYQFTAMASCWKHNAVSAVSAHSVWFEL